MEWMFAPFFVLIGILSIGAIVLWIWALVDCIQVPDDSMYESGNKLIWVLIIVFTNWIGALLYLLIGRPRGPKPTPQAPRAGGDVPPAPGDRPLPPPPGSS